MCVWNKESDGVIDLTCDLGSEERQQGVRGDQEPGLEEGGEQQRSVKLLSCAGNLSNVGEQEGRVGWGEKGG